MANEMTLLKKSLQLDGAVLPSYVYASQRWEPPRSPFSIPECPIRAASAKKDFDAFAPHAPIIYGVVTSDIIVDCAREFLDSFGAPTTAAAYDKFLRVFKRVAVHLGTRNREQTCVALGDHANLSEGFRGVNRPSMTHQPFIFTQNMGVRIGGDGGGALKQVLMVAIERFYHDMVLYMDAYGVCDVVFFEETPHHIDSDYITFLGHGLHPSSQSDGHAEFFGARKAFFKRQAERDALFVITKQDRAICSKTLEEAYKRKCTEPRRRRCCNSRWRRFLVCLFPGHRCIYE